MPRERGASESILRRLDGLNISSSLFFAAGFTGAGGCGIAAGAASGPGGGRLGFRSRGRGLGVLFGMDELAYLERKLIGNMMLFNIIIGPVEAHGRAFIPRHIIGGGEEEDLHLSRLVVVFQPLTELRTRRSRGAPRQAP